MSKIVAYIYVMLFLHTMKVMHRILEKIVNFVIVNLL